uniref:Bifunctional inhibitor/plant lipid transfer protein/seed storage helical domain-containing protein n=1 Tax=Zea mays TaxID=4577 RepID=A0A804M5E8_MAIZE
MTSRRDRLEPSPAAAAVALLLVVVVAGAPASGQVATSCTASLISTFTPCLNFVTGSTNGGGSPTKQCCGVLAEMVRTGADCACLILTGNVPFSLPINRTLAVSLPKLCSSTSVPLQCRDTATQIPAPGPIAFAPALPPLRKDLCLLCSRHARSISLL